LRTQKNDKSIKLPLEDLRLIAAVTLVFQPNANAMPQGIGIRVQQIPHPGERQGKWGLTASSHD
jgi:hypothetical protein